MRFKGTIDDLDQLHPFSFVPEEQHAAILAGVSTYDATANLNAMFAAGRVFTFPAGAQFMITGSIRPPSGARVNGNGARITCPSAGWLLDTTDNFGLINCKDVSNVKLHDLHLVGTKNADNENTPKLIYHENIDGLWVSGCVLENTAFEGFWGGGDESNSTRIFLTDNYVKNAGYPAGGFAGLPAIQCNFIEGVVSGNILQDVGVGIGASGARIAIIGNRIDGVQTVGIGLGDGYSLDGNVVTGNSIRFSSDASIVRRGILVDSGSATPATGSLTNISGNTIRINGTAGHAPPRGISTGSEWIAYIANNTIDVAVFGYGIEVRASAGSVMDATVLGNMVRFTDEGGMSYGIIGIPGGAGNTLKALVQGNHVKGLGAAFSSFAYDFNANGGGTLNVALDHNTKDGALARLGQTLIASGASNDVPFSM